MIWKGRLRTAIAIVQLLLAVALVRLVPLRFWRRSLGSLAQEGDKPSETSEPEMRQARLWALHVERAAGRMPFAVKCLPQAMVLQWQLRRHAIASRLVIAMLKDKRKQVPDPYHAWVEMGDVMVLGNCDRSDYAVLMILSTEPD